MPAPQDFQLSCGVGKMPTPPDFQLSCGVGQIPTPQDFELCCGVGNLPAPFIDIYFDFFCTYLVTTLVVNSYIEFLQ
ncbi:hypothetical protein ACE1CI_24060, partial [Aerosakkonemataceae cyanobacterium BLCC-F50]